jgi:hypothetical protein
MMGEHGEQSIQSNLESYNNLDNILNQYEKRKSNVFGQKLSRVSEESEEDIRETKQDDQIKEIKVKEIFVNSESLKKKNQKDKIFLNTDGGKIIENDIWNKDTKLNDYEENEVLFEKALKEEKKSRKNPLKLLEVFIKRIQRLCNKLLEVKIFLN